MGRKDKQDAMSESEMDNLQNEEFDEFYDEDRF